MLAVQGNGIELAVAAQGASCFCSAFRSWGSPGAIKSGRSPTLAIASSCRTGAASAAPMLLGIGRFHSINHFDVASRARSRPATNHTISGSIEDVCTCRRLLHAGCRPG